MKKSAGEKALEHIGDVAHCAGLSVDERSALSHFMVGWMSVELTDKQAESLVGGAVAEVKRMIKNRRSK
jgi:hypothetical protein